MKTIRVRLTFTEPVLGSAPSDKDIYRRFVASKAPEGADADDEAQALGSAEELGETVFPRMEDGTPFLYDYQVKGFFKDACGGLRKVPGSASSGIKAFKKEIDKLIFPQPRRIPFLFDGQITECQRPIRGQTAQGERISLLTSEQLPAGTALEFSVSILCDSHEKAVREWLDYGRLFGLGRWRSSGMGRFTWEELD